MKTILYATDYSENSVSALRLAYTLVQKFDAKLIVMHVFDIPISLASTVSITYMKKEKRLFTENRTKLKKFFIQHLGEIAEDADVNFEVDEDGSVPSKILEKAIKFNADLICVGTKGASALKEFVFGSTTKTLIRQASCAVLAVPDHFTKLDLETMVYASDFEQGDIFAIRRLVQIARKFDTQIKVVHITTKKEYAGKEQMEWFKEMLREKVNYAKLEFDLIFSDAVFDELLKYLENSEANLLAMLERKENTFYQKYLKTDMVRKMVKNIDVPLLSFNVGGL